MGIDRARAAIEDVGALHLARCNPWAVESARIIVGLFPESFDFGSDKFAVLGWERGLILVISGLDSRVAVIPTSDSRNIFCSVSGVSCVPASWMLSMHYKPSAEELERARGAILEVLRVLGRCPR